MTNRSLTAATIIILIYPTIYMAIFSLLAAMVSISYFHSFLIFMGGPIGAFGLLQAISSKSGWHTILMLLYGITTFTIVEIKYMPLGFLANGVVPFMYVVSLSHLLIAIHEKCNVSIRIFYGIKVLYLTILWSSFAFFINTVFLDLFEFKNDSSFNSIESNLRYTLYILSTLISSWVLLFIYSLISNQQKVLKWLLAFIPPIVIASGIFSKYYLF